MAATDHLPASNKVLAPREPSIHGPRAGRTTWGGEVRNVSLLVAIGVNAKGYRNILGIVEGAKEDRAGWSGFLKHLKARGLQGVELIISDACIGLIESAA